MVSLLGYLWISGIYMSICLSWNENPSCTTIKETQLHWWTFSEENIGGAQPQYFHCFNKNIGWKMSTTQTLPTLRQHVAHLFSKLSKYIYISFYETRTELKTTVNTDKWCLWTRIDVLCHSKPTFRTNPDKNFGFCN